MSDEDFGWREVLQQMAGMGAIWVGLFGIAIVISIMGAILGWIDLLDPRTSTSKAADWSVEHRVEIEQENVRLGAIRDDILILISERNFFQAELLKDQLKWDPALKNPWSKADPNSNKWSSVRGDLDTTIRKLKKEYGSDTYSTPANLTSQSRPPPTSSSQNACETAKLALVSASTTEEVELATAKVEIACQ